MHAPCPRVRQPRRLRHFLLAALATLLVTVGLATPAIGQPATAQGPAPHREGVTAGADPVDPGPVEATRVCEESSQPGEMACQALVRTDVRTHTGLMRASTPAGYGPEEIRDAYNLPDSGGEGVTVAIVDAFDNPNAEGDLAVWREQYGLPPCTTENGCFEKIDQRGGRDYPAPDRRWGMEIALDLDAVSAVCPQCNILLVEADDNYTHNLGAAVNQAVAQGADVVSNSYSGSESARNAEFDSTYYDHPGVAITASSGDDDYEVNYPAASQYVTAVGGTTLTPETSAPRGWAEQVWSDGVDGAGSGCSAYEPKPSWQTDSGCDMRTVADVSAVADPATGLAVYNTYQHSGWTVGGGTSLSAPLIAAMYGLAGQPGSGDYPASYPYAHTGELYDVIAGNNGDCDPAYLCTGVPGYDGPTGLGTPNGVKALEPLGPHGEVTGTVTDAATGAPIDGAEVTAGDAVSRTDANGQYELVVSVGSYDLTATAYGYHTQSSNVTITEGGVVSRDLSLGPVPTVTVSGTVTEGSDHGWPLYAAVTVEGAPDGPHFTDPVSGRYELTVPTNASYKLSVEAKYHGYPSQTTHVSVGGSDLVHDFALPADPYTCTAPGYEGGAPDKLYTQTFDGPDKPSDWTVADNVGNDQVWQFDGSRFGNRTGGDGLFAEVLSVDYGADGHQDTSLVSPVLDLSSTTTPAVWFSTNYSTSGRATADVDLSVDGGSTWTNAWRRTTDGKSGDRVRVPLPQAAGEPDARVRFHYTASYDTWWQVDDVMIGDRTCTDLPGGLVVGNVRDRNNDQPLVGATVQAAPTGVSTTSSATPGDPGLDDGFYWLFASGSGSTQLTATQTRYQADTRTVDVAGNTATRADFAPSAGLVTLGTTAVTATTELGESTTSTVTLHNAGTAPATVHLAEAPGHVEIRSASTSASSSAASGPPVRRTHGHFSPGAHAETAKGAQPRSRRQALAAAGPSALPWEPATDYPTVVAGNAVGYHDGTVYSVGGYTRSGPTAAGYSYEAESGRWSPMADMPRARESAAGEFLGGKLYVAGGWSVTGHVRADMDVYDPHTNTWSAGPHLPTAAAGSGTAVLDGKLYVVGGCRGSCGKQFVLRYDPDTRSWSTLAHYPRDTSRLACGGIDGKVYCAGGATDGGSSARTYAYDPGTDTWTRKADLPIDLWGMASTVSSGTLMVSGGVTGGGTAITNQGFAYHPDTDTWTALPNSTYATYNSGSACGFYKVGGASTGDAVPTQLVELLPGFADCGAGDPVAWLSASHTGATLQPGETVHVELRVDGSAVSQPGTYTAGFEVRADTPYATNRIGVTAEVTPPARWGKLTGVVSGESCDGSTQPLPGATVLVRSWAGDHTLRTDRNGRYTLWLDHRSNPLSLLVVTSGWTPETVRVRVKAGKTTTRNIDLQQSGCTNSHRRSS